MKGTFVFICIILISCSAFSQTKVTEGSFIITLPKKTQKLTEREFISISKNNFDESNTYGSVDHLYKIGDALFSFRKLSTQPKFQRPLEKQQQMVVGVLASDKEVVIDNVSTLSGGHFKLGIIRYHRSNNSFLRFVTEHDRNNVFLTGLYQFKQKDSLEVRKNFEQMISEF